MRKKILAVAASAVTLLAMTASLSVAQNRVEVKVTNEPISSGKNCEKAGGFSLEFDTNTQLMDGDQITMDLDYESDTSNVTLCRDIDIVLAPGAGADIGLQTLGGAAAANEGWIPAGEVANTTAQAVTANIPLSSATSDSPVTMVDDNGAGGNDADFVVAEEGVVFHVSGTAGAQNITLDVVGIDTADGNQATAAITVGDDAADKLVIRFLDQDIAFTSGGIYTDTVANVGAGSLTYETAALISDNTLCVNVENWTNSNVSASMDSAADKFTFIPSNPVIAHLVAPDSYAEITCEKSEDCGVLELGSLTQTSGVCDEFESDITAGGVASDYCTSYVASRNKRLIIAKTTGTWDVTSYQVQMNILVNGVSGDNGVYFSQSEDVGAAAADTSSAACAYTNANGYDNISTTYYLADGTTTASVDASPTDCTIATASRATGLVSAASSLGVVATSRYVYLNVPAMVYDLAEVEDGDVVTISYTLSKAPCGEITTGEYCLGSLATSCGTASMVTSLPYFTPGTGDSFWDGLAIVNRGMTAGVATITMYEADGDVATASVSVDAMSMSVNLLSTMIANGDFTQTSGTGTIGDSRSWFSVSTTFDMEAFVMIANSTTGEAMGYIKNNTID